MKHVPVTRIALTAATIGLFVGAAALVSAPSQAQPEFVPASHRSGMAGPMSERGPMMRWLHHLELSRDQRAQVDALLEPMRDARRERFVEGRDGPGEMARLLADGTFSRAAAVELADAHAARMRERMIEHAAIAGTIYETVLTQEQRDMLSAHFAARAGRDGNRFGAF